MHSSVFPFIRKSVVGFALLAFATTADAVIYPGNTNTGFGGPIGGTGASLTLTDNGVDLNFTVTRGPGSFNDYLVIYFDTNAGGATTLGDSGDIGVTIFGGRRAIANEFGSKVTFPVTFASDFAFALAPNPSLGGDQSRHLFTTPLGANANTLGFVSTPTVTGFGSTTSATYSWSIPLATLNVNPGESFTFLTTYLNPRDGGDASFRSNEMFGPENPGANPGFNDYTFTTPLVYATTPIPEPGTWLAGGLALAALGFGQRRRLRKRG